MRGGGGPLGTPDVRIHCRSSISLHGWNDIPDEDPTAFTQAYQHNEECKEARFRQRTLLALCYDCELQPFPRLNDAVGHPKYFQTRLLEERT